MTHYQAIPDREAQLEAAVRRVRLLEGQLQRLEEQVEVERAAKEQRADLLTAISALAPQALPQRKRDLARAIYQAIANGPEAAKLALQAPEEGLP